MKIEIEIPDWCAERHLYLMAGVELIAFKRMQESTWHVKTTRCNMCGLCCQNLKGTQYVKDENGYCVNLIPDGGKIICRLGAMRPFPCIEGDPVKAEWPNAKEFCSIRYDGEA